MSVLFPKRPLHNLKETMVMDMKQEGIRQRELHSTALTSHRIEDDTTVIAARRLRQRIMDLDSGFSNTRLSDQRNEALMMASTSRDLLDDHVRLYAILRQPVDHQRALDWD